MSMPNSTDPLSAFLNAGLNAGLNHTDVVQKMHEERNTIAKIEKYLIIGAVALAAIGILTACTAGAAAIIPFVLSAALVYGAYNIHCVKTNIDDIIADPSSYLKIDGITVSFQSDALKDKLKEKTFGFGWVIDQAVNHAFPAA